MPKGPDETTDQMFPPAEGGIPPERPLPLQPSIRETFIAHHGAILQQFGDFRKEMLGLVDARLKELKPAPVAGSVKDAVKTGGLVAVRYLGVATALGELAAQVAHAAGHPEIEGPIRTILQLLGVSG